MRSRSSNTEGLAPKQISRRSKFQDTFQDMKHRAQKRDPSSESEEALPCPVSEKSCSGKGHQTEDLSRDDLLFLLSILEGELQARDEVIGILRAEKIDLALLEAHYGFVTPKKVLEALQRDAFQVKSAPWQEDIYEKPMNEVFTVPLPDALKTDPNTTDKHYTFLGERGERQPRYFYLGLLLVSYNHTET